MKNTDHPLYISMLAILLVSCSLFETDNSKFTGNNAFSALAGINVNLPGEIKKELLKNPGRRIYFDSAADQYGYYFIDNSEIHGASKQPLIVKVIDEDNDMALNGEADKDSDIYIAYWNGGSRVNGIIDYLDSDADGYADMMYMYGVNRDRLYVTYSEDIGKDHQLFTHANYVYDQEVNEWSSDFNGDEYFVFNFYRNPHNGKLIPDFEIAFGFYDFDNDSCSESAIRIGGTGNIANNARISFDLDNDNENSWPHHHDYDFSISATGQIDLNNFPSHTARINIRGMETEPVLLWNRLKDFAFSGDWDRLLLTWDEQDNNVYPLGKYLYERWEGVINHESAFFPRVGGPSGGTYNKRNEIALGNEMKLYYSRADRRIHLKNMEKGWLNVDFDFDSKTDLRIDYIDKDRDGFIDRISYDFNDDGVIERIQLVPASLNEDLPFEYEELSFFYQSVLDQCLQDNNQVIKALKNELAGRHNFNKTLHIEYFYMEGLKNYWNEFRIGKKISESKEGMRYYTDLIREYYWYEFLKRLDPKDSRTQELISTYDSGDFDALLTLLSSG